MVAKNSQTEDSDSQKIATVVRITSHQLLYSVISMLYSKNQTRFETREARGRDRERERKAERSTHKLGSESEAKRNEREPPVGLTHHSELRRSRIKG